MTEGAPKPYTDLSWAEGMERMRRLRRDPTVEAFHRYARQFQAQPYRSESMEIDGVEYSFDPPRQIENRPYGKPPIPESLLRAIWMGRRFEAAMRGIGETAGRAAGAIEGFGAAVAKATEADMTEAEEEMRENKEFAGIDFADSYEAKTCVFIVENLRPPATAMIVGRFFLDHEHRLSQSEARQWQNALMGKGMDSTRKILRDKKECLVTHPMIQTVLGQMERPTVRPAVEDIAGGWRKYLYANREMICRMVKDLSRDHSVGWGKGTQEGWDQYIDKDRPEWLRLQQSMSHPFSLKAEVFIDTDDQGLNVEGLVKLAKAFAWEKRPGQPLRLEIVEHTTMRLIRRDVYEGDGTMVETAPPGPRPGTRISEIHGGGVLFSETPEDKAMHVHDSGEESVVKREIDPGDAGLSWDEEVKMAEAFARKRTPGKAIRVELWKAGTCKLLREDTISADGKERRSELINTETGQRKLINGTYEKTSEHNGGKETPPKEIPMTPYMRRLAIDSTVELARHGIEIRTDRVVGGLDAAGNVKSEVHTTEVDHGSPLICEHHAPTPTMPCRARPEKPRLRDRRLPEEISAERHIEYTGSTVEFLVDLGRWREDMISEYRRGLGPKGWPTCSVVRHPVDVVIGRMPRKRGADQRAQTALAKTIPYQAIIICRPCHAEARKIRERTGERIDIEQGKIAK